MRKPRSGEDIEISIGAIVIDCGDPPRLMAFWRAVTNFEVEAEGPGWSYLRDPSGRAPGLGFQKVPEGKVVKNRVHIDLYTPDHEAAAARIEGLGGSPAVGLGESGRPVHRPRRSRRQRVLRGARSAC